MTSNRIGKAELILFAILAGALVLRLWAIDHGLPFVFNPDEELHFVPHAVDMFGGSFNPGYFENPPALTYLFYAVFKLRFTAGFPFGDDGLGQLFREDPESVFLTARIVVAFLGTGAVALTYWAGMRFFDKRAGLIAAALIAFTFLPVFYSKQALNDTVTMAPVAGALVACLALMARGRRRDWLIAGAVVGVACAVKYTAGAMLAVVALAAFYRWRDENDTPRQAIVGLALAGVAFTAAFLVLNPFALIDVSEFRSQLGGQSAQGASAKLGQDDVPAPVYYLWTLTWGFGWLPAIAAAAGGLLALRDERRKAVLLIVFPLVLFVVLSTQGRYFGRWLMPAYPALSILAAYAATRAVDALPLRDRARASLKPWLVAIAGLALVAQGLIYSVHSDRVLARTDTREQARDYLLATLPPGQKIVVEPFIPNNDYLSDAPGKRQRYFRFPVKRPFQAYEKRLKPGLIDTYRRQGYCHVVVGSTQKQRGPEAQPSAHAHQHARSKRSAPLHCSQLAHRCGRAQPGALLLTGRTSVAT